MHLNILMGAIANGGVYVTPYYIDSIKTPFGLPTYVGYGTPGERLLKAETADALKDIMRYTVETNYGDSMFPGLTVCAKTGTGEIGEDKNPNGWMTGFTLDSDCPLAFTIVVEIPASAWLRPDLSHSSSCRAPPLSSGGNSRKPGAGASAGRLQESGPAATGKANPCIGLRLFSGESCCQSGKFMLNCFAKRSGPEKTASAPASRGPSGHCRCGVPSKTHGARPFQHGKLSDHRRQSGCHWPSALTSEDE